MVTEITIEKLDDFLELIPKLKPLLGWEETLFKKVKHTEKVNTLTSTFYYTVAVTFLFKSVSGDFLYTQKLEEECIADQSRAILRGQQRFKQMMKELKNPLKKFKIIDSKY